MKIMERFCNTCKHKIGERVITLKEYYDNISNHILKKNYCENHQ